MRLVLAWRRSVLVLAMLTLSVLSPALVGVASVGAQESDTERFFGFAGDVTIDGEPLTQGAVIVAMVDEVEVGRTVVNRAGAWIIDVVSDDFSNSPCNVSFVFDGRHADPGWETCESRVRLALRSPTPEGAQTEQAEQAGESSTASVDEDEQEAEAAETDDGELMSEDDGAEPAASQERQIVRPSVPSTGTGGVLAAEPSTNWPRAAALSALLMFGVAVAALVISRGTDSSA